MDSRQELLIIDGTNKTDSVESVTDSANGFSIRFKNSAKPYNYNASRVRKLKLISTLDPESVIIRKDGRAVTGVTALHDFGEWLRVERGERAYCWGKSQLSIEKNCLADSTAKNLMEYFRAVADAVSLTTDDNIRILSQHYERISQIGNETVLAKYLSQGEPIKNADHPEQLIFPFGINLSQRSAVENAFSSQVSIIQGPPGTGKTQTILNIIANALIQGKTIAVVSNNNSATANVVEKLEKYGLSFLTAFLGSRANKDDFLKRQTGRYPDMSDWVLEGDEREELTARTQKLQTELGQMLGVRNRIAEIQQELANLKREQPYFEEYFSSVPRSSQAENIVHRLSSDQALELWLQSELMTSSGMDLSFWQKVKGFFRYGLRGLSLFKLPSGSAVPLLQRRYYLAKQSELDREKGTLERKLESYRFADRLEELSELSMQLLKAELAARYQWRGPREIFDQTALYRSASEFNREYPIILSTAYSIRSTLAPDHAYDYLLVDEASQVDVVTGVLAFSCARSAVIVGDGRQLPNVIPEATRKVTEEIWNRCRSAECYNYAKHSLLSSVTSVWPAAPATLLREHYRCHPKIAGFCNQKFYDNQLIILTEDKGEPDVLALYRTPPGNHARGHFNQRQIDSVKQEVIPRLAQQGYTDVGIIAPYRDQVTALTRQLGSGFEVDTVHKFQGREKESIVLSTVDDKISDFVDDPHMLNVAVSRAVKCLAVITSHEAKNSRTNVGDLVKYIEYNDFAVVDSSVRSVFDLLYKGYSAKRRALLSRSKLISEYDSENLMYALILEVLSREEFRSVDCVVHTPLGGLVKDYASLTSEETAFAQNPFTHTDFLLFHRMDKMPRLVVEVDGYRYHQEGTRQAERDAMKNCILGKCGVKILRLRTNESGEEARLVKALRDVL